MAVGAGPASGMGLDGGSLVALCRGRRWADRAVVPWASGDRAQAALCRSRRRCAHGLTRLRVVLARLGSGGRAWVRAGRGVCGRSGRGAAACVVWARARAEQAAHGRAWARARGEAGQGRPWRALRRARSGASLGARQGGGPGQPGALRGQGGVPGEGAAG